MGNYAPFIATGAQLLAGESSDDQGRRVSKSLKRRAGLRRAASQREAGEERRQARYLMSKARAKAAMQGGGADPSVVNAVADIEALGEYNALSRLWEGEEEGRGDEDMAREARMQGGAEQESLQLAATGSFLEGADNLGWFGKYG